MENEKSKYSPFNVYEIFNNKDKINSNFRLEGFNQDSKLWESITHGEGLLGYDTLGKVASRIYQIRNGDLENTRIRSEYPQSNSIHQKGGIWCKGKQEFETALILDKEQTIRLMGLLEVVVQQNEVPQKS